MDSQRRSIAKAVSYRAAGSLSTGVIFYLFTGKLDLSIGAGLLDSVTKLVLYFLHERIWNNIHFGRPAAAVNEAGRVSAKSLPAVSEPQQTQILTGAMTKH